jgi:hypothetical protein
MTQMQTTWRDIDISAYVDGELDPAKQSAFETALAQDHALRQKVKEMRQVVALVRAAPLREPPRNYLLTPSMVTEKAVTEKSPQRTQRRSMPRHSMPLLFMRLATSLAAVAFVVTAGLTFVQRGVTPTMMSEAPKAAGEMPVMEAPRAAVVTVEVTKEVEVMLASEPKEMPEEPAPVEEGARAEKAVESEEVVAAQTPAAPAAMPQPSAGGADETAAMNVQAPGEVTPQPEVLALESAPAAEEQVVSEAERTVEDNTGTLSATGEGEWLEYNATEPAVEEPHETVTVKRWQTPSWWLPAVLGTVTLLLAGITYWMSRRR